MIILIPTNHYGIHNIHNTETSTTDVINASDQPGRTSEDPSNPPPRRQMKLSADGKSNENYVPLLTLGECLSCTIEKIILRVCTCTCVEVFEWYG